jgi:hypothetical protein
MGTSIQQECAVSYSTPTSSLNHRLVSTVGRVEGRQPIALSAERMLRGWRTSKPTSPCNRQQPTTVPHHLRESYSIQQ